MKLERSLVLIFLFDAIILILSVFNIIAITEKAHLPISFHQGLVIKSTTDNNLAAYEDWVLIKLNGTRIEHPEMLEFSLDVLSIGDTVSIALQRSSRSTARSQYNFGSGYVELRTVLTNYYDLFFIIINTLTFFAFVIPAIFVLFKCNNDLLSRVFHHLALSSAAFIMFTWGKFGVFHFGIDLILRIIFEASVFALAGLFIHFTFIFPTVKWNKFKIVTNSAYAIYSIILLVVCYFLVRAHSSNDPTIVYQFLFSHSIISQSVTSAGIIFGFANLIHSYFKLNEDIERRKLRWVLYGISLGPFAFIFLWQIPKQLLEQPLIPEWAMILMTATAPILFTVAIIRYRILDIDVIISRSAVYSIVITLLLGVYVGIVYLITSFISETTKGSTHFPSILASFIILLLFNPLKLRVQNFVDKRFFKVKYNYIKTQEAFLDKIKYCMSANEVRTTINGIIEEIFIAETYSYIFIDLNKGKSIDELVYNIRTNDSSSLMEELTKLNKSTLPIALQGIVEDGIEHDRLEENNFGTDFNPVLIYSGGTKDSSISGTFLLSRKKSGFRYTQEDVNLLKIIAEQSALAIGRIELNNELLINLETNRKLSELNKLKSYFVSSVSHDLKTPLTSIRMFAEILEMQDNTSVDKKKEYLVIIQNECDRLSRLINNVLDYSRIESGLKKYKFSLMPVNETISTVAELFKFQLEVKGFQFEMELLEDELYIEADKDSFSESLINLISNSIKYSFENRFIRVESAIINNFICISVKDKGIGIANDELEKVFDVFYRSSDEAALPAGGTGLGLSNVKHNMNAHNGRIEVQSEKGKGSIFKLYFPINKESRL